VSIKWRGGKADVVLIKHLPMFPPHDTPTQRFARAPRIGKGVRYTILTNVLNPVGLVLTAFGNELSVVDLLSPATSNGSSALGVGATTGRPVIVG
jgi:hypothetical protein